MFFWQHQFVKLRVLLLHTFACVQVSKPEPSRQVVYSDSCYFDGFWWTIKVSNEEGNTGIYVLAAINMARSLAAAQDVPKRTLRGIEVSAAECMPKGGVRGPPTYLQLSTLPVTGLPTRAGLGRNEGKKAKKRTPVGRV